MTQGKEERVRESLSQEVSSLSRTWPYPGEAPGARRVTGRDSNVCPAWSDLHRLQGPAASSSLHPPTAWGDVTSQDVG